ncbi:hypothetical protein NIES208_04740 [[Limnothrix rosea] IAM M-220]|nr:hypothetical protein NIES208_04740 [[Limnothrix rosea] IAM M-220]
MSQKEFLQRITQEVESISPNAEVFLYGSRARGDATEESDWDLLILVDGKVNQQLTDNIRHHLYEIEWETDTVVSSIIRSKQLWHTPKFQQTPFYQSVKSDAILLSA